MEMSLYEFILGLVGTFFVFIPALGVLFYMLFKELKKGESERKELRTYHQNILNCLQAIGDNIQLIAENICCCCHKIRNVDDEEEE